MSGFRIIVAALLLSVAAAGAQDLQLPPPNLTPSIELHPAPAFDPAQQTMIPPATADGTCACTMEYNPMCGKTSDGERKTFSNECVATCEKAEIVALGPC